jgi:hypothetical protein
MRAGGGIAREAKARGKPRDRLTRAPPDGRERRKEEQHRYWQMDRTPYGVTDILRRGRTSPGSTSSASSSSAKSASIERSNAMTEGPCTNSNDCSWPPGQPVILLSDASPRRTGANGLLGWMEWLPCVRPIAYNWSAPARPSPEQRPRFVGSIVRNLAKRHRVRLAFPPWPTVPGRLS